jgi:hypothetical protein
MLAVALRVPGLDESVWFDEMYMSKLTIGEPFLLLKSLYSDIHPPAYYLFMHLWDRVFGDSELSLRTPPMLFGIATILLLYRVGSVFVGRWTGLLAAFLAAVSPVHIWYSQEARPYSAQLFLVLAIVLAFVRLGEGKALRRWTWAYAIATACLVFTHYYMAGYAIAVSVLAHLLRSPARRRIHVANLLVLAVLAVWVGVKLATSEFTTAMSYLRAFGLREAWLLFFDWFLCGNCLVPVEPTAMLAERRAVLVAFQGFAVALVVCGGVRLARTRPLVEGGPPPFQLLGYMLLLPAFLLVLPWLGMRNTYIERSALPSLPFFLILLASGITALPWRAVRIALTGITAVFAAVTLACYFAFGDYWTVYKPNPDWRSAARFFGAEIDGGGAGRRIYTAYSGPEPLTYYDPRIQEASKFVANEARFQRLVATVDRWFGDDGFAHRAVVDLVASYERWKADNAARMRLTVVRLGQADPREAERDTRSIFYVLCHGRGPCRDPEAIAVLGDPGVEVVATRTWRWITVHAARLR